MELTASALSAMKIKVVATPDDYIFIAGVKRFRYARTVVPAKLSASGIHVFPFQSNMEGDMYTCKNLYVDVVLSGGTNMFQDGFEHMTKKLMVPAPSAMKIMVVAPPGGNIFNVGAIKRFRCAEV